MSQLSQTADFLNVGRIENEARTMKISIEWKISEFFSLVQNQNQRISSPTFMFLDATWCLSLHYKDTSDESWIGLYLIKKKSVHPCSVEYNIGIKDTNGSIYRTLRSTQRFRYDGTISGTENFIKWEEISKRDVVNWGKMTVFCILHAPQVNCCEMTTQTELHKGKNECTPRSGGDLCVANYEKMSANSSGLDKTWQDFKDLLFSGEDSDVIVRVKDQEFKVHKLILKTRSPVFRSMFQHPMKEETSGIIDVTDCDPVAFKDFLCYLYCGRVERLSTNNVFDLYRIGDKYDVEELKEKCTEFMMDEISVNSFPDVITLAMQHDESALIEMATSFFIENAPEITEAAKWLSFVTEHPAEANELFRKTLKAPKK